MQTGSPSAYRFAGILFDPERGMERDGRLIRLPAQERRMLAVLLAARGRVVSKEALVSAVWRGGTASDTSISRSVYRLRRALAMAGAEDAVATVYGGGFRMAVAVSDAGGTPAETLRTRTAASAASQECIVTARELLGRRALRDMVSASLAVRRAVRLDPRNVDAWTLMAQIAILRVNRGQIAARGIGERRARWALSRALAVNPRAAGALALTGWIEALIEGRPAAGLARIDEALHLDAADWISHMYRGWALYAAGRPDEGLEAFETMRQLNPLATFSIGMYGYALGCRGRTTEARALLDEAARAMPNVDSILSARSAVAIMAGDVEQGLRDARRCAELAPDLPNQLAALACAQAAVGEIERAHQTIAVMKASRCSLAPSWHALALATAGEREAARRALAEAARGHCTWLPLVRYDPRLRDATAQV